MAKSKKTSSGAFNLNDLNNELNALSSWGTQLDDPNFIDIDDWISTGNLALNALISGDITKGIPSGRITTLAGPEQTGKTFLALNVAREAQLKGYYVIWFDTENAISREQVIGNFNIDPSKFRYERINTVSELTIYCKKLTNSLIEKKEKGIEIPKIILFLDSIGNLASTKEVDDAVEGVKKQDMTRARDIKSFFRIITTDLGKLNIPMVAINHVYVNVMSFFGGNSQSGGCLTKGHQVLMADNSWKAIETIKIGEKVKTLRGPQPVIGTHHFQDKKTLRIHLVHWAGKGRTIKQTITCTPEHKFLIKQKNNKRITVWKEAKDLEVDTKIALCPISELTSELYGEKELNLYESNIVKIDVLDRSEVFDIAVEEVSHYILENGIVSHNSGLKYAGSVNVELTKAQLKDSKTNRIGVTVTAKLEKARFAAPHTPIKLQILFSKGMNKFIGLESFMDENTLSYLKFGPGKYKDGTYSYDKNEFPNAWVYFDENKQTYESTSRKTVYQSSFFTPERLEKLNEIVKLKLQYQAAQNIPENSLQECVDEIIDEDVDE